MAAQLEELIVAALSGEENEIQQLFNKIKSTDVQELRAAQANFDSLFDAWDDNVSKDEGMAKVCVELAEKDALGRHQPAVPQDLACLCDHTTIPF